MAMQNESDDDQMPPVSDNKEEVNNINSPNSVVESDEEGNNVTTKKLSRELQTKEEKGKRRVDIIIAPIKDIRCVVEGKNK